MTPTQHALAFSNTNSTAFQFDDHTVRVITMNGELWFVAADVCKAIAIANHRDAIGKLDDDEKGVGLTDTPGGGQEITIVSEPGMYTLTLRCRDAIKPGTLPYRFRRWVTHEVLPAIRRTGSYGTPKIDPEALLLEGQSTPTLPLPESVQKALDQRAWELVGQAHELIREHLRRRAAYCGECGPSTHRFIDEGQAIAAIARGDLGDALTHAWQVKMKWLVDAAELLTTQSAKFLQKIQQGRLAP